MDLPVMPPVAPMLSKAARELPRTGGYLYEPKWDGFRCIVFRDGDEVELGSRNERPLTRYFPELIEPLKASLPQRAVVDGEIVIAGSGGLDFDALLQRIHPADSRVRMLAEATPASFVAFDLIALDNADLRATPFRDRRSLLEKEMSRAAPPVHLTPATTDPDVAQDWFERFEGAGLEGVVAKGLELPYKEDARLMVKVKHERTADCVVAGFRWYKSARVVGSLLLGLYDEAAVLHHVGVAASFTADRRRGLLDEIFPYRVDSLDGHPWKGWGQMQPMPEGVQVPEGAVAEGAVAASAMPEAVQVPESAMAAGRKPGAPSRWNATKDLSWEPLAPHLVCEVSYEHLQGNRFRHTAHFKRWRTDRDARSCTYSQLDVVVPEELESVFGAR